jgi:ABC-2 type transport system ATP-binding protein
VPDEPPIISVENLSKTYASGLAALKNVNLAIRRGEIFALLGPNGAGKTTLIGVICGLVNLTSGAVIADGHDIVKEPRAARSKIGLVPQELSTDMFETVWATVSFSRGLFGKPKDPAHVEKVLKALSLWDRRDTKIMALSGGMKRRVLVAQALVHKPPVIVLDEPTAGVDVELRQGLWQFVRRLNRDGHTIVLTTHYLEEAETYCNRIAMLKAGGIAALDSTRNLLQSLSGLELRLRLDGGALPQPFPAQLVSQDGALFVLRLDDHRQLELALARLREARANVMDIEVRRPDLEDVFLRLTGREK